MSPIVVVKVKSSPRLDVEELQSKGSPGGAPLRYGLNGERTPTSRSRFGRERE
jgi:hypothetical protein